MEQEQGWGRTQAVENMVPRGRIELPTPAFSGPRSTGELPRHSGMPIDFTEIAAHFKAGIQSGHRDVEFTEKSQGHAKHKVQYRILAQYYFMLSSNSRIQSFFFSTSRGFEPSGGPTIPSFSIRSIRRAARP
jgi:hypothetical protein